MWEKHLDLFYYQQEKIGQALMKDNSEQHLDMQ